MDEIKLTNSEIGRCFNYSYQVTKNTDEYYKQRNQYAKTEKLVMDHCYAKLSEIYVYYYLVEKGYTCSYPDFKISKTLEERYKNHTFDPDLVVFKDDKKLNIHIKACRQDSPVPNSWLIQKVDKCVTNPGENDFFAFCVFHAPDEIRLVKMVEARRIKWQPTKANLPSKLACYLDDLEKDPEIIAEIGQI